MNQVSAPAFVRTTDPLIIHVQVNNPGIFPTTSAHKLSGRKEVQSSKLKVVDHQDREAQRAQAGIQIGQGGRHAKRDSGIQIFSSECQSVCVEPFIASLLELGHFVSGAWIERDEREYANKFHLYVVLQPAGSSVQTAPEISEEFLSALQCFLRDRCWNGIFVWDNHEGNPYTINLVHVGEGKPTADLHLDGNVATLVPR